MKFLPIILAAACAAPACAADLIASYGFNGTLAADQADRQALTAVDATGTSGFVIANVFGTSRTAYHFTSNVDDMWDNDAAPLNDGLVYSNADHAFGNDSYSVTMTFRFTTPSPYSFSTFVNAGDPEWGTYVTGAGDPDNPPYLEVGGWGPSADAYPLFTIGSFHSVALSVSGGVVEMYQDGHQVFGTDEVGFMNITDPDDLLKFFVAAPDYWWEYGGGEIASLDIYSGGLTHEEAVRATALPAGVPEPASWALMLGGFGLVGGALRARRKVTVSFG